MSDTTVKLHNEIIYPTVRVRTKVSGGSGTVVYSKNNVEGAGITMVMTNHHVIEDCIKVEKRWDSVIGQDRKQEIRETVHVEFFKYNNMSRCVGNFSVEADIVAYDKEQDMALLKVRDRERLADNVAYMFPHDKIEEIHTTDTVYACGAAMGHAPILTNGQIVFMDDEIDNYKYWLSTANTIYGNSGGAIFRYSESRNRWEYSGIPSRIAVTMSGFSSDAITHMGWFVPIDRIVRFLETNCYQFVYDDSLSSEECKTMRDEKKRKADAKLQTRFGVVGDPDE